MTWRKCFLLHLCVLIFFTGVRAQKTYELISEKTGKVNINTAASLPLHIKAVAALYSAMGGTDCLDQKCVLTTALGLGSQGSEAQKSLIKKYFPDDKVASLLLGQDCYLSPGSSSSFSKFLSLQISVNGKNVQVNYRLAVYEHGEMKIIKGPDNYFYNNQTYKNTKRVLYAWAAR